MSSQLKGNHPGSSPIPNECLGCLTGGGHKGNVSYNWKKEMNLTVGGTFELKTHGSGVQSFTVPSGGGTLVIECIGTGPTRIYMKGVMKIVKRTVEGGFPDG